MRASASHSRIRVVANIFCNPKNDVSTTSFFCKSNKGTKRRQKYMLVIYLALISLISIIVCIYDKVISKRERVELRIPEKVLLILSALGGSVAMYITMQITHHKTKHTKFMIGIPVIMILQAALVVCYFYFLK